MTTKTAAKATAQKAAFDPNKVEVKTKLVVPQLKYEQHEPCYFKVTGELYQGKPNPEKPKDKPADLCRVIDLVDGEEKSLVVPAVLKSVWDEDYAENAYVDKCFMLTKRDKMEGKRYFNYDIAEIADPA